MRISRATAAPMIPAPTTAQRVTAISQPLRWMTCRCDCIQLARTLQSVSGQWSLHCQWSSFPTFSKYGGLNRDHSEPSAPLLSRSNSPPTEPVGDWPRSEHKTVVTEPEESAELSS